MRNCVRKFNTLSKIGRKRNSQLLLNSPPKYSKGTLNITHCNAFPPKIIISSRLILPIKSVK